MKPRQIEIISLIISFRELRTTISVHTKFVNLYFSYTYRYTTSSILMSLSNLMMIVCKLEERDVICLGNLFWDKSLFLLTHIFLKSFEFLMDIYFLLKTNLLTLLLRSLILHSNIFSKSNHKIRGSRIFKRIKIKKTITYFFHMLDFLSNIKIVMKNND